MTAFGRKDQNETATENYIKKDIMELTTEDLKKFDAVVDAFGAWTEETLPLHSATTNHLADILSGTNVRREVQDHCMSTLNIQLLWQMERIFQMHLSHLRWLWRRYWENLEREVM